MILEKLPSFQPVAAGQRALLKVPKYAMTLTRVQMVLGGTFTKANIEQINVKIGSRVIWDLTGLELEAINSYKGLDDPATHLTIDFTEKDAGDIVGKEIGGIDMTQISGDEIYIEVKIAAAAVNPTLRATAFWTPPQGNDLIKKYVKQGTANLSAGRTDINFNPMGSLIQRMYIGYTGTDWGASANGNVADLRVRKNGNAVWDEVSCLDARVIQAHYGKVPQSKFYVYDPIVDNNQSGALVTADAKSLLIQPLLTASDTLACIFEVLDKPFNL